MALNLEEQEQLSKLGYFWKDWGKYILSILILLLAAYLVWFGYKMIKKHDATKAGVIYDRLVAASQNKEQSDYYLGKLIHDYPDTEYAVLGALVSYKRNLAQKNYSAAQMDLSWIINSGSDKTMKPLAKIQLAFLYAQQKNYQEALNLLQINQKDSSAALTALARGDIFLDQGNLAQAKAAYQEAIRLDQSGFSSVAQVANFELSLIGSSS